MSASSRTPRPMTVAELQAHPEYPHVTWNLKPTKKAKIAVAEGRGGPVDIAYEVHGTGPICLMWIMGLGGFKSAWQRQTKYFGHQNGDKYSHLIFDNRGICESDKPWMRYSTSEMAKDALELADHLGWTKKRQLHVIGISMGGMIAQEMGFLAPDRIASLHLTSTAPRLVNTVGVVENFINRANLFIPRSLDAQLRRVKFNLYSPGWLVHSDELEHFIEPFPTNGDRFAAAEVQKRSDPNGFQRHGFIAQAIAAGWHHKSDAQLKEIADKVGRERIMVVHGTEDRMITFPHAEMLVAGLGMNGDAKVHLIQGQGHVIPAEMREDFNGWVENLVQKAEALDRKK